MPHHIPSNSALLAFEAAARHGSFARAADELALTEGAISRQIARLEDFLGVALFDRTVRPLGLTKAGKLYAEFCRDVLNRQKQFEVSLEALKSDVESTVRVASISPCALCRRPRFRTWPRRARAKAGTAKASPSTPR